MTDLSYIELTLNVSLATLVQSFCGNRTESECAAAIDLAWDSLDVSDLDVALEYSPSGLSMATARISGAPSSHVPRPSNEAADHLRALENGTEAVIGQRGEG